MGLLKRFKQEDLEHALELTTYQLLQMVSDGEQQKVVQEIVERNLKVLNETYEEFMENINLCRQ
jgi:Pyruvate/2-oxoacid:ferredoxin oxidoreductase gamma subunit